MTAVVDLRLKRLMRARHNYGVQRGRQKLIAEMDALIEALAEAKSVMRCEIQRTRAAFNAEVTALRNELGHAREAIARAQELEAEVVQLRDELRRARERIRTLLALDALLTAQAGQGARLQ